MQSALRHRRLCRVLAPLALAASGCGAPEKLAGPSDLMYIAVERIVTDASGTAVKDAQVEIWRTCGAVSAGPDARAVTNIRGSFSRVFSYLKGLPGPACVTVTVTPRAGTGLRPATLTQPSPTPSAERGAAVARFDVVLSR